MRFPVARRAAPPAPPPRTCTAPGDGSRKENPGVLRRVPVGGSVGNREGAARAVWKVLRGEASWPRRAGGASLGWELRAASCARPLVTSPRVSPPAVCSPSERCPPWSSPRPDSRWSGSATRFSASAGGGVGFSCKPSAPGGGTRGCLRPDACSAPQGFGTWPRPPFHRPARRALSLFTPPCGRARARPAPSAPSAACKLRMRVVTATCARAPHTRLSAAPPWFQAVPVCTRPSAFIADAAGRASALRRPGRSWRERVGGRCRGGGGGSERDVSVHCPRGRECSPARTEETA